MRVDDGFDNNFPVGMRVLAVDDDPTCLQVLANLLCRCDYQVTITNEATKALHLLREDKDKFDLVISDVYMPDMDGFKLLELVGLEMDLPVIMLSGNNDPSLVMKGITHGACDYLTKPVRMQELKNIWQHVVRRRYDPKGKRHNGPGDDQDKLYGESEAVNGNGEFADLQNRVSKKRRDQNEVENNVEENENAHESEECFTQKKPRVVWSADLHKKFLAAVNLLGLDKAVPKKILELMNDDKLTRENVASHLQKFRHSLRRISNAAAHQDCRINESSLQPEFSLPYLQAGQAASHASNPLFLGCGPLLFSDVMQYKFQSDYHMNLHPLSMINQQQASFLQLPQTSKLEEMPQNFCSTSPFHLTSTEFISSQQSPLSGETNESLLSLNGRKSQDEHVSVDMSLQMCDPDIINGSLQCTVPLNDFSSATLPLNDVAFGGNHSIISGFFLNGAMTKSVDGIFKKNMKMKLSDLNPEIGKSTDGIDNENQGHPTISQNKSTSSFEDQLSAMIKQRG